MSGQIASWKIRIALEEKKLQGYKSIMIIQPDQIDKNDSFWKNNEYGIIPSLRIQDITLNGVLPILLFLETSIPSLLPESSLELKGQVLERAFESLEFQRVCSEDLISYFFSFDNFHTSFIDKDLREKREKKLFSELSRWNDYITQTDPMNCIVHTSFTLADVLFFPELALAVQFGLSLDCFSCLSIYYETLSKRPSIRKTWPYHWLHTNIKYDWLSNVNRFAMLNIKQQKLTESTLHQSIDEDKNENTELLSRLIFGEKRKPNPSPARHQSSTRNSANVPEPTSPGDATANKTPLNIQDWAVWRMQLNEQMGSAIGDQRSEVKHMRHFLQSNSFYQQHSRDPSSGRYNGVHLLFSIPRANIKPEFLDESRGEITKSNNNEVEDVVDYEEKKVRSNSDDRTTTSVNSISAVQPMVIDKTIGQLLPKASVGNTSGFLQTNEPMIAVDGIHPRRSIRRSFIATDRIHATLQKAVKDGNVLEKIKAFEMQAAAAQAVSGSKLGGMNYRIQHVTSSFQPTTHHRSSPAIVHPMQHAISPIPIQHQKQQTNRSGRGRFVHSVQQQPDDNHESIPGHKSRKGAHVLEPAHGDIILKRRTPSQTGANDEDYSITAISSMPLPAPQSHHRNNNHHHHYHHRTSASRSRQRQEAIYDKRAASKNENSSHKNHQKTKGTTTSSGKLSTRRRWLKGRKEGPAEASNQGDKQQSTITKSNKINTNKKKNMEQEKINSKKTSTNNNKEKLLSDNNRVYGVPNTNIIEQTKIESPPLQTSIKHEEKNESDSKKDTINNTNTFISLKQDNINQIKECDTIIPMTIQRKPSKKYHQQKLSGLDEGILNQVDDDNRFNHPATDDYVHRSELNDDDNNDDDKSEGDVFIEETPIKPTPNIIRHQSVLNLPNNESRRFQQQSSYAIRRHASQCSSNEYTYDRHYQQSRENSQIIITNTLKKKPPPITLITRKNKLNQDEQFVYEAPHSDQTQVPMCNSHTTKKKRPFHTINVTGTTNSNNGQNNNNKQISKQILHAIMNSMNNNQEQTTIGPPITLSSSVNDEFFENGPLTNPEETMATISTLISK
ncbi:unnamed protein product [Rotaria sp. Silwood1]|nr:unnamed protein product [Rotaria sp. Silwood1]